MKLLNAAAARLITPVLAIALILISCSDRAEGPAPAGSQAPVIAVSLMVGGQPIPLTASSEVGPSAQFRVDVISRRSAVTEIEYRFGTGDWISESLDPVTGSAVISPAAPFTGDRGRLGVRATSADGITGEVTFDFQVDARPPEITSVRVNGADFTGDPIPEYELHEGGSGNILIEVAAVDPGSAGSAHVIIEVNGSRFATGTSSLRANIRAEHLAPGVNQVLIFAADSAGNLSPQVDFNLRLIAAGQAPVPPSLSLVSPRDGEVRRVGSNLRVIVDVIPGSDSIDQVFVDLDGAALTPDTQQRVFTGTVPADPGTYLITAWVTGADGARSLTQSVEIVASDDAPSVEIVRPLENRTYLPEANVEVQLIVTDNGGGIGPVSVTLEDGTLLSSDDYAYTFRAPSVSGEYSIVARAESTAGSTTVVDRTIRVTPAASPAVTIISPEPGASIAAGSSMTVILSLHDGGNGIGDSFVTVGGAPFTSVDGVTFTGNAPLTAGTADVVAWAVSAGSRPVQSERAVQPIEVVAGAPTVTILHPAAGTTVPAGTELEVLLSVEDGGNGIGDTFVTLAGTPMASADGVRFVGMLPDAATTVRVEAWAETDTTPGTPSVPVGMDLEVSNAAPFVTLVSPEDGEIFGVGETIHVTVEVEDRGGGIGELFATIDGAPMTPAGAFGTFSAPAPSETDEYRIEVWAETASLTAPVRSAVAQLHVWVDATPPAVHITYPGHGAVLPYAQIDDSIEVEIQAEDFGSELHQVIVEYNNGGDWIQFATLVEDEVGTVNWNPQAGPNILRATARDRFGNIQDSDVVAVFVTSTPEFTGPELSLLSPFTGSLTAAAGSTIQFEIGMNPTSSIETASEEFWLNLMQVTPVQHADWTDTRRVYTWDIPADQDPGTYVLFYHAHGDSPLPESDDPTEMQSGTTVLAILVTVE